MHRACLTLRYGRLILISFFRISVIMVIYVTFIVTAEESCRTLVCFVYKNIETDILMMFTALQFLHFAPNIRHI